MSALEGKVAVVLGASTRNGIGAAIARSFARAGARVIISARGLKGAEEVAREVNGMAVSCDVTNENDVQTLIGAAVSTYGGLHVGVDVAGAHASEAVEAITRETLIRIFDVNVVGSAFFIKHCAAAMNAGGSIIIVSSHAAQLSTPRVAPYACSKAAQERLVEIAALEYGARGIRVNSLSPSILSTSMSDPLLKAPGMRQAYEKETPLGRLATVEDVAAGALYLAGDDCCTTGDRIRVGGGVHLRRFPQPEDLIQG
jgi:NAD(P)-dependent dehydrogenase (short-subunit alcohol dehydrogenase family)